MEKLRKLRNNDLKNYEKRIYKDIFVHHSINQNLNLNNIIFPFLKINTGLSDLYT